jgi:hypothetical protein
MRTPLIVVNKYIKQQLIKQVNDAIAEEQFQK